MSKAGLLVAVYFTIVSGCTMVDSPPSDVKSTENSAALVPFEPAPVINESDAPSEEPRTPPAPVVARHTLTPDEIRRMQVRMRDLELDPGPIDGIAGVKTRSAVKRFHLGCGQLKSLLDGSQYNTVPGASLNQIPSRQETLMMQHQLRAAGFNPGPVDGIFGAKMKTIFTHLQNGCPAAQEFVGFFEESGAAAKLTATALEPSDPPCTTQTTVQQSPPQEAQSLAAPGGVEPQDEIRVLQLRLREAGYDPGPVDGLMGPKTKLALQQMQASQRGVKAKLIQTTKIVNEY